MVQESLSSFMLENQIYYFLITKTKNKEFLAPEAPTGLKYRRISSNLTW